MINEADFRSPLFAELSAIGDELGMLTPVEDYFDSIHDFLSAVTETARDLDCHELSTAARWFAKLVELGQSSHAVDLPLVGSDTEELANEIAAGVQSVTCALKAAPQVDERLSVIHSESRERWAWHMESFEEANLLDPAEYSQDFAEPRLAAEQKTDGEAFQTSPTADEVTRILAAIDQATEAQPPQSASPLPDPAACRESHDRLFALESIADAELADAFLDDACRCVASMEESLLAYESTPENRPSLKQLCRDLHTLKGASGSVGLTNLAEYLHHVENDLQGCCGTNGPVPDIDSLLGCVDVVQKQIAVLRRDHTEANADAKSRAFNCAEGNSPSPRSTEGDSARQPFEQSLRVNVAQIDRIMDMLAELVMLRNRRETHVEQLKHLYGELASCASRLRTHGVSSSSRRTRPSLPRISASDAHRWEASSHEVANGPNSLNEVASDILEIAHRLREFYAPVAAENLAVSRFIGQFRQELVALQRVPVAGLFRRLHRSVRDAARAEGKQVLLDFCGEETGIDRSLQERLYEPLLHIVRNAVSHGIEDAEARLSAGKDRAGKITLEARGGANSLVIEVRDDGKGLDYDALRRRGLELGLLRQDRVATREELAQLIFRSGFSTRSQASEVSGRGVGMDVVAITLERLRSWIEVESSPGTGTTVRITIPLRSVIEHAMVFRSGSQQFALPMRFVHSASKCGEHRSDRDHDVHSVRFADLFDGERRESPSNPARLVIGYGGRSHKSQPHQDSEQQFNEAGRRVALIVDELVGPDEVVIRSLPPLLQHQSLYAGVTLAGTGEIVLVFDTQKLVERSRQVIAADDLATVRGVNQEPVTSNITSVLVVDDSVTARRTMSRMLRNQGYSVTEMVDGVEALDCLQANNFDLVVTDLDMPRLGGWDLIQRIRESSEHSEIPVIITSSRQESNCKAKASELNALAFLTKPVDEETLVSALALIGSNNTSHPK